MLDILRAIKNGIAFLLALAYNTGVSLLESGLFLVVFIVIMVVIMITGWRRNKPTT
jgi:hypothetical protein